MKFASITLVLTVGLVSMTDVSARKKSGLNNMIKGKNTKSSATAVKGQGVSLGLKPGSNRPQDINLLEEAAMDVTNRALKSAKASKSPKTAKGLDNVLIKNLECAHCLIAETDTAISMEMCFTDDDSHRWNFYPCDKAGIWFQLGNVEYDKCLKTTGPCSSEVELGECDPSDGNTVWGYVGGQLYSYECFVISNDENINQNSLLDSWCPNESTQDVDTDNYSEDEEVTWIVIPDFSGSKDTAVAHCDTSANTCSNPDFCRNTPGGVYCDEPACFPEGSLVSVVNGNDYMDIGIEDLRLGDIVKCVDGISMEISNCTVFFHYHPSPELGLVSSTGVSYRRIIYGPDPKEDSLIISDTHIMYRLDPNNTNKGDVFSSIAEFSADFDHFPQAKDVKAGSNLIAIVNPEDSTTFKAAEVIENQHVILDSAYAPLVSDGGMIIVDGVVASSYVVLHPNIASTIHYQQSARYSTYLYGLIVNGTVDASAAWNKKRDDPEYKDWETDNYRGFLRQGSSDLYWSALKKSFMNGLTLTIEMAIRFNKIVMEEKPNTEARMAELIAWAYEGQLAADGTQDLDLVLSRGVN